ncbi:MAG: hypothetical protein E4H40_03630 [Candidatus Brocadiia bacterium]|nr:MAG: hypothetical protein E4H40_03630 [Candidatus Brocadiia bacterium]
MCNVTALQSGIYYITDFGGHFENCNSNTRKSQASSSFWPDSGKKNLASFSVNAGRTMQCDPTGTIHLDVFYNYSTFLNSINESPATYALPDAVPGRRFTVVREDPTAGADVIIDPKSTDIIIKIDGTPMAAGESYQNVSDAFGMVTLECFRIGFWQVVEILGTWVEETPP